MGHFKVIKGLIQKGDKLTLNSKQQTKLITQIHKIK